MSDLATEISLTETAVRDLAPTELSDRIVELANNLPNSLVTQFLLRMLQHPDVADECKMKIAHILGRRNFISSDERVIVVDAILKELHSGTDAVVQVPLIQALDHHYDLPAVSDRLISILLDRSIDERIRSSAYMSLRFYLPHPRLREVLPALATDPSFSVMATTLLRKLDQG
jgi:hypothetical protein